MEIKKEAENKMAEILLKCKCGKMQMYQKYIKGIPNRKHWFIVCKNCNIFVETREKERAIDLWNTMQKGTENDS